MYLQNGKYDVPQWLSSGSRQIIKEMLEVDPEKRITVEKLLTHPWIQLGYNEPVSADSLHQVRFCLNECVCR